MRRVLLAACLVLALTPGCVIRKTVRLVTRAEHRELSLATEKLGRECVGVTPEEIDDSHYSLQCARLNYDCVRDDYEKFECRPTPRSVVLAQVRLDSGCSLPMWIAGDASMARIDACGASYLCEIHGTLAVCKGGL